MSDELAQSVISFEIYVETRKERQQQNKKNKNSRDIEIVCIPAHALGIEFI